MAGEDANVSLIGEDVIPPIISRDLEEVENASLLPRCI